MEKNMVFPELKDPIVKSLANRLFDILNCFDGLTKLASMIQNGSNLTDLEATMQGLASCGRVAVSSMVDLLPLLKTDIPTE